MKTILKSFLIIVAVVAVAGGATYAYFTSTASSTGNTFTAGTLTLNLSNGTGWSTGVNNTWTSPANWAPGQTVTKSIYLKNTGSIPAAVVYANWNNFGGNAQMANYIEVTWLSDSTGLGTNNIAPFVALYDGQQGNNDGHLSLAELMNGVGSANTVAPNKARFYADDGETYLHPVLAANGGEFEIKLGYTFMASAPDTLQGQWASFDLVLQAAQLPSNNRAIAY